MWKSIILLSVTIHLGLPTLLNDRIIEAVRLIGRNAPGTRTMNQLHRSEPTERWLQSGKHVKVLDRQVFVHERGEGPLLLFMHGFPTSCYDWRGIIDQLCGDFRCITFDFLGYGFSDKPEDYSYSLFQQADLVEQLLVNLGIDAAHVISHDMGTSVHCELLARANRNNLPWEIVSSTLTNGSMLQWMARITPFQQLMASNETLTQAIEMCRSGLDLYIPAIQALMQREEALSDEDLLVMEEILAYQQGGLRLPALAVYMRERYLHRDRWLGALAKAGSSIQFVWSDGDPIATMEMGREAHRICPKSRMTELPGLGHFLIFEDPQAVANAMRPFIKKRQSLAAKKLAAKAKS